MGKKPSFMKAILQDNEEQRKQITKSLDGERFGYMGDPSLDWSCGGYMRGGMNLFYGPSKSGKSTLALIYAGQEYKKKEGVIVYIDTENALDDPYECDENGELSAGALKTRKRIEIAGIPLDYFLLIKSNRASQIFSPLAKMEPDLKKDPKCVAALIVDSWEGIQSTQTSAKVDSGKADEAGNSFGGNAKTINPIIKRLVEMNVSYGLTVFGVTHVRANMDQYGPRWILPGGQTFVHLHNMIMLIEASETKNNSLLFGDVEGNSKSDTALKVGKLVRFKCDKSRRNVEGRTGEFFMNFHEMKFAKPEESLFNLAVRLGIVVHPINPDTGKENKLWWQYPAVAESPIKWQGVKGATTALSDSKELYDELWKQCQESGNTRGTDVDLGDTSYVTDAGKLAKVGSDD